MTYERKSTFDKLVDDTKRRAKERAAEKKRHRELLKEIYESGVVTMCVIRGGKR